MTQNTGSAPPAPVDRERVATKSLAELRQAVWEASQFRTTAAVREYVELVIREIDSDAV